MSQAQIQKLLEKSVYSQFESEIECLIFGPASLKNKEILMSSLQQCRNAIKTACNRRIKQGDLSFECFDCAIDLECHLICDSCFSKTSHSNHKFRYFSSKTGLCDCGNSSAINSHCPDHSSSAPEENVINEYLPPKTQDSISKTFTSIFYELFLFLEKEEHPQQPKDKDLSSKSLKSFSFFLKYLKKQLKINSPALDLFLTNMLQQRVNSPLSHLCNNYLLLQFQEPKVCDCSVLDALFRLSICLKNQVFWGEIMRFLEGLMKYADFRRCVAVCYAKHWNFIVYIPKYPQLFALRISQFLDFYPMFFGKDVIEVWLKSHHFLMNLIEKTGDVIDCFFTSLNVSAYNAFDRIKSMFFFILKRAPPIAWLSEPRVLEAFIEVINKTHNPKCLIEEDNEKCRLHIECTLLMILKSLLSLLINNADFKPKRELFYSVMGKIVGFLKEIYAKPAGLEKSVQNRWPLHNTLQRSLTLILLCWLMSSPEPLSSSLSCLKTALHQKIAACFENPGEFFEKTVKTLLVSVKFSQEKVKPVTFYELFENPFEGMKREVINGFYKKSYYLQNDYDMVLLQLLAVLSPSPNDFLRAYSEAFQLELSQIYFKAGEDQYRKNLGNMLSNLVFLLNDEISLLNASGFIDFSAGCRNESMAAFREDTLKFLVINAFSNNKVKDLKSLKSLLYDKVLSFDIRLEDTPILKELTTTLPNTTTLRLKPSFSSLYDPFLFYKYPKLTNDCYDGFKRLSLQSPLNDLTIGTPMGFNAVSANPLFYVRQAVFAGELPRYITLVFKIEAFGKEYDEIMRNSVKLLFLVMKTGQETAFFSENKAFSAENKAFSAENKPISAENKPSLAENKAFSAENKPFSNENEGFLRNLGKYIQVPELLGRIEGLKEQKGMLEGRDSLLKIGDRLKEFRDGGKKQGLSGKLEGKKLTGEENGGGEEGLREDFGFKPDLHNSKPGSLQNISPSPDPKSIPAHPLPKGQKRQAQLKKDFLDKQKAFLRKNPSLMEEIKPPISEKTEIPCCFYCYEPLTPEGSFGVSVYLTMDSLSCRSTGRLTEVFKKPSKRPQTYSLTSCLHYVHRDCNEKMMKNNLKALLQKKVLYTSVLESLCGHCKSLNNLFVYFNEEKVLSTRFTQLRTGNKDVEFGLSMIRDLLSQINLKIPVKGTINPAYSDSFSKDSAEFFDLVLRILLDNENMDPIFGKSETSILETFLDILTAAPDNVSLNGLSLFLKRNRPVYRNVYLMFREYFWSFQCKDKPKYIDTIKKEADEALVSLFGECSTVDIEEIDRKAQRLLWILALLFKNEDSTLYLMVSRICGQLFQVFLVYYSFSSLYMLKPSQPPTPSLDLLESSLSQSSEFRALLASQLVQPARKLAGTLALIFGFEDQELRGLSPENFPNDEEELEFYAQRLDPSVFTLNMPKNEGKNGFWASFIGKMGSLAGNGVSGKEMVEYYPLTFHILPLPGSYLALHQAFGLQKCSLCSSFSTKGVPYLCLVCGIVLCSVDCGHKAPKTIGNLNSHARSLHAGKGGFMNLQNSLVVLINYPRSITFGHLYRDEYGESLNERTWKWEKFGLDVRMYGKIQDMMIGKRVPQEICYRLMENEELVLDVDYL